MSEQIIAVDNRTLISLAAMDGNTGFDLLLTGGHRLLITQDNINEFNDGPYPGRLDAWLAANTSADPLTSRIITPDFVLPANITGQRGDLSIALLSYGENVQGTPIAGQFTQADGLAAKASLSGFGNDLTFRFLADEQGVRNREIYNKPGELELRGQYAAPYEGTGHFLIERFVKGDITEAEFKLARDSIMADSNWANIPDNPKARYKKYYLNDAELEQFDPGILSKLGIDPKSILPAGVIGAVVEVARQAGLVGDILSFGITVAHANELRENDQDTKANEVWVKYIFETAGGLAGSALGALGAIAVLKGAGGFWGPILGAVAGGVLGSLGGAELGEALYKAYPEIFDPVFDFVYDRIEALEEIDVPPAEAMTLALLETFGFDLSAEQGGEGNDWIIATDWKNVDGKSGDDVLIGWMPGFIAAGDPVDPDNPDSELAETDLYMVLDGGDGDDIIGSWRGEKVEIDAGAGDDIVFSNTALGDIRLGDGNDWLIHAGRGSVIHTGPGGEDDQDTILFSMGTQVTDADGWDRIYMATIVPVTLATAYGESEKEWAYGVGGLFKVGFNIDGEMVLGYGWDNDPNNWMYLANGNRDPLAPDAELTAGIRVGQLSISAYKLEDLVAGKASLSDSDSAWEYFSLILKRFFSEHRVAGSDPLVLDLDGDGLELTAITPQAPTFDVDGDQYAERTGWVAPDDGLLAMDRNSNGMIDDVSELFGNADQSGFHELALLDSNGDGVIDSADDAYDDLLIWQDHNQNGISEAGELITLEEAGIESINLTATDDGTTNALNTVARTGTFTRTDGTTSTVGDIEFRIDNFNTVYTGDKTINLAAVDGMPNLKGYGTLADLHVVLSVEAESRDPGDEQGGPLAQTIASVLPTLNVIDLDALRTNALPILEAWADASPFTGSVSNNPDVPVLAFRGPDGLEIQDFAIEVTEDVTLPDQTVETKTFWRLASGTAVTDDNDVVIDYPTYGDVMAQIVTETDTAWEVLRGAELDYMERFMGEEIPVEDARSLSSGAVDALSDLLTSAHELMELQAVRLAMQGPLEPYFDGVAYDVTADSFVPTTDRQMVPMFEAIFNGAPSDNAGATQWLQDWEPLIDTILVDYKRGGTLPTNAPFLFTAIVAAAENTGFVLDPVSAGVALGIDPDTLVAVSGTETGADGSKIYYLSTGADTVDGAGGADIYVIGQNFGNDTIADSEEWGSHGYDVVRFAHHVPGDLLFERVGIDLIITDTVTGDVLTITGQYHALSPSLSGNHLGTEQGISEIVFADGTVWTDADIAVAVSHPTAADETLIGTDHMDYLDGGAGNDYLSGGSGIDVYVFGLGYGQDQFEENMGNHLLPTYDVVKFETGITQEDLTFSRVGDSTSITVSVGDGGDEFTIISQFAATYTGVYATQWYDTIEAFLFEDGTELGWQDMAKQVLVDMSTEGNDTLYGFDLEDTIEGGLGDDYMSGGNEDDIYIYNLGDGNDTIREARDNIYSGATDHLKMRGVSLEDVTLVRPDNARNNLEIHMPDGGLITIEDQFGVTYGINPIYFNRIEFFEFIASDGTATTLTHIEIMDLILQEQSTDGDDTIIGFKRDETIEGGLGDDVLDGLEGADTYIYNIGDGHDRIHDNPTSILDDDGDVLSFGAGILPTDVIVSHPADSLDDIVISFVAHDGSVTLDNQVWYTTTSLRPNQIEQVTFQDGTIWTPEDLRVRALLDAKTDGDDTIHGFFSDDVLDGGAGNDYLAGGDGADTYLFGYGYGNDTIAEGVSVVTYSEFDIVEFGTGIALSDVSFARGTGNQVIVTLTQTGETLTIQHQDSENGDIEEFHFEDGAILTSQEVFDAILLAGSTSGDDTLQGAATDDTINGGAGNDTIYGDDGDDTLIGGQDDDRIEGGNDADTYIYNIGDGHDVIQDKATASGRMGGDTLSFGAGILPEDVIVTHPADSLSNLVLSFASFEGSVTLVGQVWYTTTSLRPDQIEQVTFANGTVWTAEDLRERALLDASTDGDDTIHGFFSDDIIDGGAGNDFLAGGDGADTYIFGYGFGNDTISESVGNVGYSNFDVIEFGAGITAADVTFARGTGSQMIITLIQTGETLTIEAQNDPHRDIEEFRFEDGTVITALEANEAILASLETTGNDIITGFNTNDTINGGVGDDTLSGSNGDDTLIGGLGNDTLHGGDDSDTYVFNPGDGQDVIDDNGWGDNDKLVIHGYTPADMQLSASGNNIIIQFAGSTDMITVVNGLNGHSNDQIEQFIFDDGTVYSAQDMSDLIDAAAAQSQNLTGTDGPDTLIGGDADDIYEGLLGDDTMESGLGNDTFIYTSGDGNDTITEDNGSALYTDVLELKSLLPSDVALSRIGNDLIVTDQTTSQTITIVNQFAGAEGWGLEEIAFDDGTSWDRNRIDALVGIVGTTGDDTISGTGSSESLFADLGNDTVHGSDGSDTYHFFQGDGQDVIDDNGWDDTDRLLIHGYTPDNVSYASAADGTLTITFAGSTDQITIINALHGDRADQVEQIVFDDGAIHYVDTVRQILTHDQATDGDDTIYAFSYNETLEGGLGNDSLHGHNGSDTYVFNAGDGQDVIDDNGWGDTDRLLIHGYTPDDVSYASAPDGTLTITFAGSIDQITIINALHGDSSDQIEQIVFDDGTIHYVDTVRQILTHDQATDGDDTIYAFSYNETLEGGLGNDSLHGHNGSDTYVFNAGDGQDVIDDNGWGDTDRLLIHGYTPDDVSYASAPDGTLTITFAGSTDQITIINALHGDQADQIEQIVFDDDTIHDMNSVRQILTDDQATDGDDTIYGFNYVETLEGGLGNDSLHGHDGSDTYVFNPGDGQDIIDDNGWRDTDQLVIHGYTPADTNYAYTGDSLIITFAGSADQITISNTLDDDDIDMIEQIVFDDGTVHSLGTVIQMLTSQQATTGDDTIYGFYNGNTLEGGLGNDSMHGHDGSDTYVFNAGDGQDTIDDNGWRDTDRLLIHGHAAADVLYTSMPDGTLIISFVGSTDQVTIVNTLDGDDIDQIEEIIFDDGTVHTMATVQGIIDTVGSAPLQIFGTDNADTLGGTDGDDTFYGGLGDDAMTSGTGSDTFIYSSGDGNDIIDDNDASTSHSDVLIFTDLNAADMSLRRDLTDLYIKDLTTGHEIQVLGQFQASGWWGLDRIDFQDGSFWDRNDLTTDIWFIGTDADELIAGDPNSDDMIDGGAGDDTLMADFGDDLYLFGVGSGHDILNEKNTGTDIDTLRLVGLNPSDVTFYRPMSDRTDVVVKINSSGDTITLDNQFDLEDGVEKIEFADGTVLGGDDWSLDPLLLSMAPIAGTDGDDAVWGDAGVDDVLDGGAGNDNLYGDSGSDTYRFGIGYGHDRTNEKSTGTDTDTLELIGLNLSDVSFSRDMNDHTDYIVTINATGETFNLDNQSDKEDGVERIVFADGTVLGGTDWSLDGILQSMAPITGTDGDDAVWGGSGNDILDGGAGNDNLYGESGSDTYRFGIGYGHDRTNEKSTGTDTDTLELIGLNMSDVSFSRDMNDRTDYIVTINATGETFNLDNQSDKEDGVERIVFADGTVLGGTDWSLDGILEAIAPITGTSGDDVINGTNAIELFDGGAGNDILAGHYNHDTYLFGVGSGHDVIDEHSSSNGIDVLRLIELNQSDVTLTRSMADVYDLVVTINATGETVTLDRQFDLKDGVEKIEFADGTVLGADDWSLDGTLLSTVAITGTTGNDTVSGSSDGDIFDLGLGDDTQTGLGGDDTFVFNTDFGHDTITDFAAGASSDDVVELRGISGFASYADVLAAAADDGTDTTITIDANNTIVLQNVLVSELHSDDFRFA